MAELKELDIVVSTTAIGTAPEGTNVHDYGDGEMNYQLKCELQTPDERNPCITTIWIIGKGGEVPILIRAYPSK